ncbi:MAG: hypothetical protein LC624_01365 [Halobacteriales archaeon]|nr:hypothetical protein [Halobacteriales archaeon]
MRGPALALLLLVASLAQATGVDLAVVGAPRYTPGDFWVYRVTLLAGNNTTFTQNQTTTVLDAVTLDGAAAMRTVTVGATDADNPGGPPVGPTHIHQEERKTIWLDAQQRILRIEDDSTQVQSARAFTVFTNTSQDWAFHQPMDTFAFPILRGDAWVVITNATVTRNVSFSTITSNETRNTSQPASTQNITQVSGAQWLRNDVCGHANSCNLAGEFDVVVLLEHSGNNTLFDFYSPLVGNLVRREIYSENGSLLQTVFLTGYQFQQAPTPTGTPGGGPDLSLTLVVVAVGIGALLGLVGVAAWKRKQRRELPPQGPGEPPASP